MNCILNWLIILLILIAFNYIFSTLLEYLNDRNWKDEIPISLKDFYQKDKYLKAKEYKDLISYHGAPIISLYFATSN